MTAFRKVSQEIVGIISKSIGNHILSYYDLKDATYIHFFSSKSYIQVNYIMITSADPAAI
jgi:hypothetical protein